MVVKSPFVDGEPTDFILTRSKTNPSVDLSGMMVTETAIRVNSSDSKSYEWIYGKTEIVGMEDKISQEQQDMINMYEGISLSLSNSDQGLELDNYEEVKERLQSIFITLYGGDKLDRESEIFQRVEYMFAVRAANGSSLISAFFPEVTECFAVIGKTFNDKEDKGFGQVLSPYSDTFLASKSTVEFENEEVFSIYTRDSVPQDVLEKELLDYLTASYGPQASEMMNMMPKSNLAVEREIELDENDVLKTVIQDQIITNDSQDMVSSLELKF